MRVLFRLPTTRGGRMTIANFDTRKPGYRAHSNNNKRARHGKGGGGVHWHSKRNSLWHLWRGRRQG